MRRTGSAFRKELPLGIVLSAIVLLSLGACRNSDRGEVSLPPPSSNSGEATGAYAEVVKRVAPAVVTIRSERRVRAPRQHPFFDDPFFRDFFGGMQPAPREQVQRGLGSGVIINSVEQGSPAERAGLKQGAAIVKFNGADINDGNSLRNMVASAGPGAEAKLTVLREGREQQLRATLDELSSDTAPASAPRGDGNPSVEGRFGMSVAPLTPKLAAQLGLRPNAGGVVVTDIDPAGAAADAGMQPGDVIEQVNRQPVRSVEELKAALDRARDRPALLLINRRGVSAYLTLRPNRY